MKAELIANTRSKAATYAFSKNILSLVVRDVTRKTKNHFSITEFGKFKTVVKSYNECLSRLFCQKGRKCPLCANLVVAQLLTHTQPQLHLLTKYNLFYVGRINNIFVLKKYHAKHHGTILCLLSHIENLMKLWYIKAEEALIDSVSTRY